MKIYFDGCSWTHGCELQEPENTRWSKLVSDYYGAEEYNISENGSCNRRIVRNLLEHNLDDYDIIIIQMSMNIRQEYFDGDNWQRVSFSSSNLKDASHQEFFMHYYSEIYHSEYGHTDDKIYYTLIKKLLEKKKHLVVSIDRGKSQSKLPLDMDLSLMLDDSMKRRDALKSLGKTPPYSRNNKDYRCKGMHPNEEGSQILSHYIISALESEEFKNDAICSHHNGWWSNLDHDQWNKDLIKERVKEEREKWLTKPK